MAAEHTLKTWLPWRSRPGSFQRIAYLLFFAIVAWFSIQWLQRAWPLYLPRDWSRSHEFDALIDWKAARLYLRGISPFSPEGLKEVAVSGFGHPPTTAFWFLPLARFDKAVTAEILGLTACLCVALNLYICGRELKLKAPILWTVLLFSWVMTTQGMLMHWDAIQLSAHIALALALCWMYLRRGRDVAAGIMLGIALSLKLFPGVLVLMLVFAGRFRAVVAAAIVFSITSFTMTAVFGFDAWLMFFEQQGPIAEPWIGSVRNASLQGVVLRALTPVCVMPAPASKLGSVIAAGISVVLLGWCWFASRRAFRVARMRDPRAIDLPFALFAVLAVFVNAWTWEHGSLLSITSGYIAIASSWRSFQTTFRGWLEEIAPLKTLIGETFVHALTILCLLAVMEMFAMNINMKVFLPGHYRITGWPALHAYVHFFEIISWLPWALMLVLCLGLLWRRSRAMRLSLSADAQPLRRGEGSHADATEKRA